jgi:hypothetical protein
MNISLGFFLHLSVPKVFSLRDSVLHCLVVKLILVVYMITDAITGNPANFDVLFLNGSVDLPGFTRSVYKRDHALITPESHVFGPLPDWYA